tara:strand:- start:842 stop:1138 length:297 start_codon:yes stop_codon:yes gene_type:complete
LLHGKYRDPKTVRAVWNNINMFENFTHLADFKTFDAGQAKSFKAWLEKQKNKNGELLSISTIRSTLNNLREFFEWQYEQFWRTMLDHWVRYSLGLSAC